MKKKNQVADVIIQSLEFTDFIIIDETYRIRYDKWNSKTSRTTEKSVRDCNH